MLVELSVMEQRYQAVLAVVGDGWTVTAVAEKWGVSRQSVHAWSARYRDGGLEALADWSHRSKRCPHQVALGVEARICEMRGRHPGWGPPRLAYELAKARVVALPSRSGIYRRLVRNERSNRKHGRDDSLDMTGATVSESSVMMSGGSSSNKLITSAWCGALSTENRRLSAPVTSPAAIARLGAIEPAHGRGHDPGCTDVSWTVRICPKSSGNFASASERKRVVVRRVNSRLNLARSRSASEDPTRVSFRGDVDEPARARGDRGVS